MFRSQGRRARRAIDWESHYPDSHVWPCPSPSPGPSNRHEWNPCLPVVSNSQAEEDLAIPYGYSPYVQYSVQDLHTNSAYLTLPPYSVHAVAPNWPLAAILEHEQSKGKEGRERYRGGVARKRAGEQVLYLSDRHNGLRCSRVRVTVDCRRPYISLWQSLSATGTLVWLETGKITRAESGLCTSTSSRSSSR